MGNLGMYAFGIPSGMMVDAKGPRWGVSLGIILFAAGYYPIARGREWISPVFDNEELLTSLQLTRLVPEHTVWP